VFGALACRPGCAPQLHCACLMSMGRLPAQLPSCILSPWPGSRETLPLRFSRAWPSTAPLRRFRGESWRWWLAHMGSHGKCETSARASATGEIHRLYKRPLPRRTSLLRLHCFSTKSRERPAVCWGVVSSETRSSPAGFLSIPLAQIWSDAAPHLVPRWDSRRWSFSSFVFLGSGGARGGAAFYCVWEEEERELHWGWDALADQHVWCCQQCC
jgi:hypothetical protein